jgi:hypothetical protein
VRVKTYDLSTRIIFVHSQTRVAAEWVFVKASAEEYFSDFFFFNTFAAALGNLCMWLLEAFRNAFMTTLTAFEILFNQWDLSLKTPVALVNQEITVSLL